METKTTRHSRYHIYYHIVWIPKYRRKALGGIVKERLEGILREIANDKELEINGLEIMPDHVHLFVSAQPQHAPSLVVNWFKGISARLYNHRFKDSHIKWTNDYYVGTAGTVTKDTIQKYILEQTKTKCQNQNQNQNQNIDTKPESEE